MQSLKRIGISIGDLNGVGIEIALKAHEIIKKLCHPLYFVDQPVAEQAAQLLSVSLPADFECIDISSESFTITPGTVDGYSGRYSYHSFTKAVEYAQSGKIDAVVTLPIHKEAWMIADVPFKGHTDALRTLLDSDAIMMLGCEELYVALYTEHIPLKEVAPSIQREPLKKFLHLLYKTTQENSIAVLGLNPHAGDHGVLGNEEYIIEQALSEVNQELGKEIFIGPIVPDVAFTPRFRSQHKCIAALYHDQGLAPLKALYFDESVNISLGLPIIRTSVDHGTAFDIAYTNQASTQSYLNAIIAALKFIAVKS